MSRINRAEADRAEADRVVRTMSSDVALLTKVVCYLRSGSNYRATKRGTYEGRA